MGLLLVTTATLKSLALKHVQASQAVVLNVRSSLSNPLPFLVFGPSNPGGIAARTDSPSTQAAQVSVLNVSTWALTTLVLGLSTPGLSAARTRTVAPRLTTQASHLRVPHLGASACGAVRRRTAAAAAAPIAAAPAAPAAALAVRATTTRSTARRSNTLSMVLPFSTHLAAGTTNNSTAVIRAPTLMLTVWHLYHRGKAQI